MSGASVERFHEFMEEYTSFMSEMVSQEDKKYSALVSGDLEQIDKTIAQQQAMLMKLEKLEEQRIEKQALLGWNGLTFQQILDKLGDDWAPRFGRIFGEIGRLTEQIKYSNEKSMSLAKMNLRINDMISSDDIKESYGPDSKPGKKDEDSSGSVFETKI